MTNNKNSWSSSWYEPSLKTVYFVFVTFILKHFWDSLWPLFVSYCLYFASKLFSDDKIKVVKLLQ